MIVFQPPTRHAPTALKVVLLSGLSDPRSCALTSVQRRFLRSLDAPESCKIYRNFPYLPGPEEGVAPPLWRASLENVRQFALAARPAYRAAARPHWQALSDSADRLLVITLSCGLEIVNRCLSCGESAKPLHIIALGPVAWNVPRVSCTLVQGAHDPVSKLFFRTGAHVVPGVGHMDYLHSRKVAELINEWLWSSTFASPARASVCPNVR